MYAVLIAFVVIQFFKPEQNLGGDEKNGIVSGYQVPEKVNRILETACNDCHSNKTVYPWYSNIQPFAWMLSSHVKDGKKHLNFSEFMTYKPSKQHHKLEEIDEMIREEEMPLASYTLMHKEAKLSSEQKEILLRWSMDLRDSIVRMNQGIMEEEE